MKRTLVARPLAALAAPLVALMPGTPNAVAQTPAEILPVPLKPIVPAAQRACAAKTASGLGYTVLQPASGPKPGKTDYTLINYIGFLAADGAVFDQNRTAPLPVDKVVPGFGEGLQLLSKGEIARFCIPAALGYGTKGGGPIPPNADLVFQVELVDFKTAAEVEAIQKQAAAENAAPAAAAPPPK